MKDTNGINVDEAELSKIANFEAGTEGINSDRLSYVANLEAGTDVWEGGEKDSSVTDDAPYKNLAKYKMITTNDDDTVNSQGS